MVNDGRWSVSGLTRSPMTLYRLLNLKKETNFYTVTKDNDLTFSLKWSSYQITKMQPYSSLLP